MSLWPRLPHVLATLTLCVSASAPLATAYELRTHGLLTEQAFHAAPALGEYLRSVGLRETSVLDPVSATSPDRLGEFENDGTPIGWLVEGSIREDDYKTNLSLLDCEPPRNPPSGIDRIRHHFLDPDTLQGLRVGLTTIGLPAAAWALGEQGRGPGAEENQFSLLDARHHQLRSLIETTRQQREQHAARMFRSLGQVVHVLQDMAQPQHTRNDMHPACENLASDSIIPEHSWYEDYIESRAVGLLFRGRPVRPLLVGAYPAPSFLTAHSYFTHPDRRRGLADFSSRNFFSAGTNLGFSANPCGGRNEPPCSAEAYRAVDVPHSVTTARGVTLAAPVRLFLHTMQDPLTGGPIPDVAVTSRSLWDQHLESRGWVPRYSMNVLNYDSISDVLLPRAAGYAAGLLDHFFAGRLDATVQPAGQDDPTVLKLVARNASDDAVDGVLLIYAEDSITAERQGVLAAGGASQPLGAVPTGVVLADGPFPEILFRPPFTTEKYVVVYHGRRLGPGRLEDPPAGAVGAVMAQVLGGPRAEAIVPQGDRRLLRAVPGTFELPPTAAGLDLIQWSDVDNHFVGVTGTPLVTGHPAPDAISLFRIERPVGSVEVPLVAGADPPVVDATLVKTVPFPYGLALPTTVDYARHVRVQQPLVTYPRTFTLRWDPASQVYEEVTEVVGPPSLEIAVDETLTFAERFPLVLDREHLFGATTLTPRPYFWRVLEVGQDARERLLAVVEVRLTLPRQAEQSVVLQTRKADCSAFEPRELLPITGTWRGEGIIALIDLERGEAIGVTAAPVYAPSSTELWPVFPFLQERTVVIRTGGPAPGTDTSCSDRGFIAEDPSFAADVLGAITLPPIGLAQLAAPGLYRDDIESVAGNPLGITSFTSESILVYAAVDEVFKAVSVTTPSSTLTDHPRVVREAARMRPATRASTELLLRFERPEALGAGWALLARWDPELSHATRAAYPGELDPGRYLLVHATAEAALLRFEDVLTDDVRTLLVDFTASTLTPFPGDLSTEFVLLPPGALYHLVDTHFYTRDTLDETALPLALAPGPAAAPPAGAYHLIVRE
jgi:hypothetical protein